MKSTCIMVLLLVLSVESFMLSGNKNGSSTKDKTIKSPKKEKCMIVKGKGKNLVGDTIYVHKDFLPTLKKIDNIAKQLKSQKFTTANAGKHLKFIIMDKTGKKLVCNNVCLAKEGEKMAEVKCLVTGLRKENLRYAPHTEVGTLDDASDSKPGFSDVARRIQDACRGVKL